MEANEFRFYGSTVGFDDYIDRTEYFRQAGYDLGDSAQDYALEDEARNEAQDASDAAIEATRLTA